MNRDDIVRRGVGVVAGLVAFGSVGLVAVPAAASQLSVRSQASQYFTWKADVPAVAATFDDPVESIDTVVVGRDRAPQVFISRSCLVGGAIPVAAETAEDGRTPGVHVRGTPRWQGCHTRVTWQIPSQVAALTVTPNMSWPAESQDQQDEQAALADIAADQESLAAWNARRAEVEKVLATPGIAADARGEAESELADLRSNLAAGAVDLRVAREHLAELRKARADALAATP